MATSNGSAEHIEDGTPPVSISWLGTKSVSSKAILSEAKHGELFSSINKKARPTIKKVSGESAAH